MTLIATDEDVTIMGPRFLVVWPRVSLAVMNDAGDLVDVILVKAEPVPAGVSLATCQILAAAGALVAVDEVRPVAVVVPTVLAPLVVEPSVAAAVLPSEVPARSASKATWREWSITHGGIAPEVAAAMTKDQLIAAAIPAGPLDVDPAVTDPGTDPDPTVVVGEPSPSLPTNADVDDDDWVDDDSDLTTEVGPTDPALNEQSGNR